MVNYQINGKLKLEERRVNSVGYKVECLGRMVVSWMYLVVMPEQSAGRAGRANS